MSLWANSLLYRNQLYNMKKLYKGPWQIFNTFNLSSWLCVIKIKVGLVNRRWIHLLEDSLPPVNIYCCPLHQTVNHSGGHIPITHGLINTPHGGAEGEGRMLMTQGRAQSGCVHHAQGSADTPRVRSEVTFNPWLQITNEQDT